MNYIYDILLNFNKDVYDFYDWNQEDEVMHIKKAPIFLVEPEVVDNMTSSDINVEVDFLDKIYKKTEIFTNRCVKNIGYLAIFSDGNNAIGIKFNKDGKNQLKSKFLIDEDLEINNLASHLTRYDLKYKVKRKNKILNKTRFKQKMQNYIETRLKNFDNKDQIKYLNYELFSIKSDNKLELINNINENFDNCYLKIYDFFKLIGQAK